MERLQNTDIPLSSLMGVRQTIRFDDNSTNIKLQSKKRLEELNDMMLERQQTVHRARMIREDINNNLIKKLKKVLSKRFKLTREEYVVLIDKFNLKNSNLTRQTISDMIMTLNIQKKYDDDNRFNGVSKNVNTINNRAAPKKINNITMNSDDDQMFKDDTKEKTFDDRLQDLINSRIPEDKKNNNNTISNITNDEYEMSEKMKKNKIDTAKFNPKSNIQGENSFNNYDISKPVNNMGEEIYFPPPNREEAPDPDKPLPARTMPKLQESAISYNSNQSYNDIVNSRESFDNTRNQNQNNKPSYNNLLPHQPPRVDKPVNTQPHLVINDSPNKMNNLPIQAVQSNQSKNIEESIQKLIEKIKIPEEKKQEFKEFEFNIMANIIQSSGKNNTVSSQFEFEVNYNGKKTIADIKRVELVSCFINENFYRKNDFKNYPYFLLKIKEFNDVLYLNGSSTGGFCQIMWEKKGSYYNYINTDKLFGIYTPNKDIEISKLTVELYDHNGNILKELKSTEQDQFNIVLKIITDKPL